MVAWMGFARRKGDGLLLPGKSAWHGSLAEWAQDGLALRQAWLADV